MKSRFALRWSALKDLLGRYAAVFRQAWADRHESDVKPRLAHEAAFLPAHLEIIETPIHPAPRWTMRLTAALIVAVALIALFGHLDIVAVGRGKLVPNARVKIIQPAIGGVVRSILVQDGAHVEAGQLLMELDPSQAAADTDKATAAKTDAELAAARARALLDAQVANHPPKVAQVAGADASRQQQAQLYADEVFNEYVNKLSTLRAELAQREAEAETDRAVIAKLQQVAPLARQQADDYKSLSASKYVATDEYLDKEQNALAQEGELRTQTKHLLELSAGIEEQRRQIASTTATFRREQIEDLDRAEVGLAQSSGDQIKATVRQGLTRLVAPVGGTVQKLSVHTLGGVVSAAQAVLEIVPDDTLEVEASIDNKDIGFVADGQDVVVKVEAFPYTRYGYLKGRVVTVSNDASEDRKGGLQFVARIALETNQIRVGSKQVALTPGMQVTAEIRTGRRTVAEYFLSPFVETGRESLRER